MITSTYCQLFFSLSSCEDVLRESLYAFRFCSSTISVQFTFACHHLHSSVILYSWWIGRSRLGISASLSLHTMQLLFEWVSTISHSHSSIDNIFLITSHCNQSDQFVNWRQINGKNLKNNIFRCLSLVIMKIDSRVAKIQSFSVIRVRRRTSINYASVKCTNNLSTGGNIGL